MKYFIAINGKVYKDVYKNKDLPRLNISNNLFDDKEEAWSMSDHLGEYKPMLFYGKPATKDGLRAYARGDSTATYKKLR